MRTSSSRSPRSAALPRRLRPAASSAGPAAAAGRAAEELHAVLTIAADGTIEAANAAAERLFGYASGELNGRNVDVILPPPFGGRRSRSDRKTSRQAAIVKGMRRDGRELDLHLAFGRAKHSDALILRLGEATPHDEATRIAELHAAVAAALAGEVTLGDAIDRCAAAIAESLDLVTAQIRTLDAAGERLELRGYSGGAKPPASLPASSLNLRRARGAAYPLVAAGAPLGALMIDARRELSPIARAALKAVANQLALALAHQRSRDAESHGLLESLVEAAPLAIVTVDLKGRVQTWNAAAERLFGWTRAEAIGRLHPAVPPERRQELLTTVREAAEGRHNHTPRVVQRRRKDGSTVYVAVSTATVTDQQGRVSGVIGMLNDVTEQRLMEQRIAALNAIASAAGGWLEVNSIVALLRRQLRERLDIRAGAVFLRGEDERLTCHTLWGKRGREARTTVERLARAFVTSSAPRYVRLATERTPSNRPSAPRAAWVVPLGVKHRVVGSLVLFEQQPASARKLWRGVLKTLGREIGVAIENATLFEQTRAARDELTAVSRRLVEVQEAERRHIGRELHDHIGQSLTGLKLTIQANSRNLPESFQPLCRQVEVMVNELLNDVRNLSLMLRPAMLDDLGLLPALLWHLERYSAQTGVRVDFHHSGLGERFPAEIETAVFRVVQEALTNVARHAAVDRVVLRVWSDSSVIGLQLEDKGVGFDAESRTPIGSSGIAGMRERVALVGGSLHVLSVAGRGTTLEMEIPIPRAEGRPM